jgi:hypothetical protein
VQDKDKDKDNTSSVVTTSSPPQHKSGVLSAGISEVLSFNVGSAFTYVVYRDRSLEPIQDLNTAKEYINREILRLITLCTTTPSGRDVVSNPDLTEEHFDLIDRVIDVEVVGSPVREFYINVLDSLKIPTYVKRLEHALIDLDLIILTYTEGATDGNLIQ